MRRRTAWRLIPVLALGAAAACTSVPVETSVPGTPGAPAVSSAAAASQAPAAPQQAEQAPGPLDAQITAALASLTDSSLNYKPVISQADTVAGTPVGDLLNLGSPSGYNLRNHYLDIGVPLSEAFAQDSDPSFKKELVTMARWSSDTETRAAALMLVAQRHDAASLPVFQEALNFMDPGVRFGALEALVLWQHPELSLPLLANEADQDAEPLLRVFAASGLARLGDDSGLHRLRDFLNNPSWLARAMAARYLGDYGTAEDYDLLVSRIGAEQGNDFVVAEDCIAALKLFPKKNP